MGFWRTSSIVPVNHVPGQQSAPTIVWIVAIATLVADMTGETIFGFNVSGFAWFIPLVFALYVLFTTQGTPRLPYRIWMPWFGLTIGYLLFTSAEHALQRTVMLVTPMVVGMAVSKSAIRELELSHIESLLDKFSIAFFVAMLVNSGLGLTGVLPGVTALAPEATTAALFATYFAAEYALRSKRAAIKWLLFAFIPVIAVTRAAIVATGLTLPFTFAPLPLWKRISLLIGVAALGLLVFNTERVQNKMFYSGEGTVYDLSLDNPDFRTSGRTFVLEAMQKEIKDSPWFGHGANASEQFVSDLTNEDLVHPHNDWLRLAFDYGYVGTFIFLGCVVFQALHALRAGYRAAGSARLFLLVGAGAFIPFALFMVTDNIILYAAFFGNLHFTMLGAGYAVAANEHEIVDSAGLTFR